MCCLQCLLHIWKHWTYHLTWTIGHGIQVPSSRQLKKYDIGVQSFVTSQDEKVGFWVTADDVYKVTCESPVHCTFEMMSITPRRLNRYGSVIMSHPDDHGLECTTPGSTTSAPATTPTPKSLGKILIATGSSKNNDTANHSWKYATNEVELLDPQSRTLCKVKNYPFKRRPEVS